MSDMLGTGQAQVLAALIRRASRGPASLADLARDTGFTRTRIRRCVAALAAKDLLERTDAGPVPRVVPLSVDSARVSVGRDYAEERRAALRKQDDPSSTSEPLTQIRDGQ